MTGLLLDGNKQRFDPNSSGSLGTSSGPQSLPEVIVAFSVRRLFSTSFRFCAQECAFGFYESD
jgi:hypothetical protein